MNHGSNRARLSVRRPILESAGLAHSPQAIQQLFWQRYNRKRGRRERPVKPLGEIALSIFADARRGFVDRLDAVTAAWNRAIPIDQRRHLRVESFVNGCLRIVAESKSAEFLARRRLNGRMLAALNDELPGFSVRKIDFRVGRMSPGERH